MNNLVVDIGNSFAKVAQIGPDGDTVEQMVVPQLTSELLAEFVGSKRVFDGAILSTTRRIDTQLEQALESSTDNYIHFRSGHTPIPITNGYATPDTLGADRLAAAVGAWKIAGSQVGELLVVDLGSAITFDRVDSSGVYLGGNISPGMAMRFEALHRLTDRLPLCTAPEEEDLQITARSTVSAIEHGVAQGILLEIEGYISTIEHEIEAASARKGVQKSALYIFFTGRDAKYFAVKIKKPIFVVSDLVIHGLNHILEYNTTTR